jgi:hypothetical protein
MTHQLSADDRRFRAEFEACRVHPDAFDHRAHVRLAYVYLAENDVDNALLLMRNALQAFIAHNGIRPSKYHETLTRAWILAANHFMATSPAAESAQTFIANNPRLLDSKIMMTHYSAEVLFSPEARAHFVEPNLDQIPRHRE